MVKFAIELDWKVDADGYRLIDNEPWGWSIARNGGRLMSVLPFKSIDNHFKTFANIRTPQQLLQFVNVHGLLHDPDPLGSAIWKLNERTKELEPSPLAQIEGERVQTCLDQANFFWKILRARESGRNVPQLIGSAIAREAPSDAIGEMFLRPSARRGVKVVFKATSLINGMWIQLAQSALGDTQIKSCKFCGAFFDAGVGTGRRADALFCKRSHQIEFNSSKRSKKPIPAVSARQRV